MKFTTLIPLIFILILSFSGQAYASPPLPTKKITEDKAWQKAPEALERNAKQLSKKQKAIELKLKSLKQDLSVKAHDIQKREQELKNISLMVKDSQRSLRAQKIRLKEEKQNIASLITSLVKMSSIPLETLMLLPPEKSENLMVSYHTLRALHPKLSGRIEALEHEIGALNDRKDDLNVKTSKKKQQTEKLKEKRESLALLVQNRQSDQRHAAKAYKEAQSRALKASKSAKNLNELILAVKKKNEVTAKANANVLSTRTRAKTHKTKNISFRPSRTKRLPVSGEIITRYGALDRIGAKSKGVTIRAVSGALVVAPKGGVVKYSGEFRKYGRIILIEHGKNYHSLVAGLDKIDTVVGQKVLEGEPIGSIQKRSNMKHSVYYELRLNGEPVNPMSHLSRL